MKPRVCLLEFPAHDPSSFSHVTECILVDSRLMPKSETLSILFRELSILEWLEVTGVTFSTLGLMKTSQMPNTWEANQPIRYDVIKGVIFFENTRIKQRKKAYLISFRLTYKERDSNLSNSKSKIIERAMIFFFFPRLWRECWWFVSKENKVNRHDHAFAFFKTPMQCFSQKTFSRIMM